VNNVQPVPSFKKRRYFLFGCALLGIALLLTSIGASLTVLRDQGTNGFYACMVALAICWLSGSLALAITLVTLGGQQAVSGMFLATAVRTGLPLACGIMLSIVGGPLADAGLFGLIVVHYLVALVTETCVAVKVVSIHNQGLLTS